MRRDVLAMRRPDQNLLTAISRIRQTILKISQRLNTDAYARHGGNMTQLIADRLAVSVNQAASQLGISRFLMLRMIAEGCIPVRRAGRRILVPLESLNRFLTTTNADLL
jgi:excisionase family DNA binding protein